MLSTCLVNTNYIYIYRTFLSSLILGLYQTSVILFALRIACSFELEHSSIQKFRTQKPSLSSTYEGETVHVCRLSIYIYIYIYIYTRSADSPASTFEVSSAQSGLKTGTCQSLSEQLTHISH